MGAQQKRKRKKSVPAQVPSTGASSNQLHFTSYAKGIAAKQTYYDGVTFIKAALLLEQNASRGYVSLHLIAQGVELVVKALLLSRDYDRFIKELRKAPLNHSLVQLVDLAVLEYNARVLTASELQQLAGLDELYKRHKLRYFSVESLLGYYRELEIDQIIRKFLAVSKLASRTVFSLTDEEKKRGSDLSGTYVYRY